MVKTLIGIRVFLGLIGIGLGICIGIRDDLMLMQTHAHLNLLGFVTMFLSALYYRAVPTAALTKLARWQAIVSVVGTAAFPAGIACMVLGGGDHAGAIVVAGAGTVLLSMGVVCRDRVPGQRPRACRSGLAGGEIGSPIPRLRPCNG